MKKLLLSGILALTAAASFAQNSVTTAQVGTANSATAVQNGSSLTATISQVGPTATDVTNNTANTNQSGTGHSATINQNGTLPNGSMYNRAYATQLNGSSATGANSATISQSNGSGGAAGRGGDRSIVTGDLGNWAGTYQTGGGNQATVMQDGPGSKANLGEITQRGTGNTATNTQSNGAVSNLSQIFQGYNLADVSSNTATVNQDGGQRNEALVNQFSDGNKATVLQNTSNSMDNKAFVTQGDGTNVTGQANNTAMVVQTGGNSNTAVSEQTGKSGSATINQIDGAATNTAFIKQVSGTGSGAAINQTTYAGATSMNDARITQYGDGQIGVTTQDFAKSSSIVIMQGSAGTMSGNNRADVRQVDGVTSSTATIMQNTTADGGQNKARIEQLGITQLNIGTISQQGSSNEAGLIQTGAGSNTATISQTGNFNIVGGPGTVAPGNSTLTNNSYAKQDGSGNLMDVKQESTGGPATATLYNNAILGQAGMGNTLTVNQTISAGALGGNTATVSQNGNGNVGSVTQINGMTP